MSKFSNLQKRDLKNSQHFDFIEAFITVLTEAGFSAQKIATLLALLGEQHQEEDRWFMITRSSEIIARRNEADTRRDDRYARLHRLVNVWAGSGILTLDEAATVLKKVFTLYKLNTKAQVNEESGVMTNLASDLSTPENLARIETIGGTQLFNEMVAANEEVKSIRIAQGTEESEKVVAALAKARVACDETYDQICALIEASELLADDPAPYTAFIKKWNGTIKLYQDMLDRKQGGGSSNQSNQNNQSDSENSGNSENSENNGGGSEQGGGTNNGDDDVIPGSGGGEVGGGDNQGGGSNNGDDEVIPGGGGSNNGDDDVIPGGGGQG